MHRAWISNGSVVAAETLPGVSGPVERGNAIAKVNAVGAAACITAHFLIIVY